MYKKLIFVETLKLNGLIEHKNNNILQKNHYDLSKILQNKNLKTTFHCFCKNF